MVERYVQCFGIVSLIFNFWTKELLIEKFSTSLSIAVKTSLHDKNKQNNKAIYTFYFVENI